MKMGEKLLMGEAFAMALGGCFLAHAQTPGKEDIELQHIPAPSRAAAGGQASCCAELPTRCPRADFHCNREIGPLAAAAAVALLIGITACRGDGFRDLGQSR